MEDEITLKVEDLIAFYKRELFVYISIEFRNKDNYFIKDVKYGNYDNYLKNESFRKEKVKEFFFKNENQLVIVIEKE